MSYGHNEAFSPKALLYRLAVKILTAGGTVSGIPVFESCLGALAKEMQEQEVWWANFPLPSRCTTSGWSNNQIDLRQVSKRN